MKVDAKKAVALVTELISINGVSCEEAPVAKFIEEQARKAGVKKSWISRDSAHKRSPAGGNSGNLIVALPGTVKGKRLMFSAHMDTVEIARGSMPSVKGNYIYPAGNTALGADDRAGVAALLNGLITVMKNGIPHPPLTFLFTVQEEIGLFGARYASVSALKKPACCFNFDGGNPAKVVLQAPSSSVFYATIKGKAAHAGQHPDKGVSAALIFAKALAEVEDKKLFGHIEKGGKKAATSNIGIINGGTASNVVMDLLELKGEARSYSEKFLERIVDTYKKSFEKAARSVKSSDGDCGSVAFSSEQVYTTFKIPKNSYPATKLISVLEKLGEKPGFPGMFGGLDANWLNAYSIPTVTLGAGGQSPHTKEERLSIRDFLKACGIVLNLIQV